MKGKELIKNIILRNNLSTLVFFVTARCNANCGFCFYKAKRDIKQEELSLEEITKISRNAGRIYEVLLSGGEPFLRDDITQIGQIFARNNGITHLNIPTNGYFAQKILATAQDLSASIFPAELSLMVSIDNLGEKHDKMRGIDGLFERVSSLLTQLVECEKKQPNLRTGVIITLSEANLTDIKDVIDYARNTLHIRYICLNYPRADTTERLLKGVPLAQYRKAVDYLFAGPYQQFRNTSFFNRMATAVDLLRYRTVEKTLLKKKPVFKCRAGINTVVVNEIGEVFLCELLRWKLGSLREENYNLGGILRRLGRQYNRQINKAKCYCSWECITHWNMLYSPSSYPGIIANLFKR